MRKIVRRVVTFACGTCGTGYSREGQARTCERSGVEERTFSIGDRVTAVAARVCVNGKKYRLRGRVVRVLGPEPYDPEVHLKGFGITATAHLYVYEVAYRCPHCKKGERVRYPAAALVPCKRP